jgi:hypothetical protein
MLRRVAIAIDNYKLSIMMDILSKIGDSGPQKPVGDAKRAR